MRMLLFVDFPNEPFNSLVRNGEISDIMNKIMEAIKPEAAYFTEQDGLHGAVMVVDVNSPSDIPALAEPFFLCFEAECRFRTAMTSDDLKKADLNSLGKKW